MTTTIQLSDATAKMLKNLKEQTKSKSYDELIVSIIRERGLPYEVQGIATKYFKKDALKGLRDKSDRF